MRRWASGTPRLRRITRRLRPLLPTFGLLAAIGLLLGAGRLSPALGGVARTLMQPLTLVLLAVIVVVLRWRHSRKTGSDRRPAP